MLHEIIKTVKGKMENKLPLGRITQDLRAFEESLDKSAARTVGNFGSESHQSILKLINYWKDCAVRNEIFKSK